MASNEPLTDERIAGIAKLWRDHNGSIARTARAAQVSPSTVHKLVHKGVPERGIPPFNKAHHFEAPPGEIPDPAQVKDVPRTPSGEPSPGGKAVVVALRASRDDWNSTESGVLGYYREKLRRGALMLREAAPVPPTKPEVPPPGSPEAAFAAFGEQLRGYLEELKLWYRDKWKWEEKQWRAMQVVSAVDLVTLHRICEINDVNLLDPQRRSVSKGNPVGHLSDDALLAELAVMRGMQTGT